MKTPKNKYSGKCRVGTALVVAALVAALFLGCKQEADPVPTYTVTFDLNGGSGTVPAQTVESGKTASEPAGKPTYEGYLFEDWYTAKDGGAKYDFTIPVTANVTLYAMWEAITASNVAVTIRGLTGDGSHTIKVSGELTSTADIKTALEELKKRNPTAKVKLDLSNTTGLMKIPEYAFQNCTNLESVTLPGTVTSIGYDAFYNCTGLTGSFTIPASVTHIGSGAFAGSGLTTVNIPASVTKIEVGAFYDCDALTSVTFKNTTGWKRVSLTGQENDIEIGTPATNAANLTAKTGGWSGGSLNRK